MTPTELELARELARHPKWKWERGMLAAWDNRLGRVVRAADNGRGLIRGTDATGTKHYPDLADPATQGCLIAALEPWLLDVSRRRYMSDVRWTVTIFLSGRTEHPSAPTLGEAIARAWLAAQGGGEHG